MIKVKPFNDVWYFDCFNHALFPILEYNGIDLKKEIFSKERGYYNFDNDQYRICLWSSCYIDLILQKYGLILRKNKPADVIGFIKSKIDQSIPVIIFIDCYYESLRIDSFMKKHVPHSLLIYGYSNNVFYIIEHDYISSLKFKDREIPIEELKKCYVSYEKFFSDASVFTVEKSFFNKKIENIKVSDKSLQSLLYSIKNIFEDENKLKTKAGELTDFFMRLSQVKSITMYCNTVCGKLKFLDVLEKQKQNSSIIAALMAKYNIYKKYNPESIDLCISLLKNLIILEDASNE